MKIKVIWNKSYLFDFLFISFYTSYYETVIHFKIITDKSIVFVSEHEWFATSCYNIF